MSALTSSPRDVEHDGFVKGELYWQAIARLDDKRIRGRGAHAVEKLHREVLFAMLDTLDDRLVAVLTCAVARLPRSPEREDRARMVRTYEAVGSETRLEWTWTGTKHSLRYRDLDSGDSGAVKPVLDMLAVLDEPIAARARATLSGLLEAPNPAGSDG